MAKAKFKRGDKVQLVTGGPEMAVDTIMPDDFSSDGGNRYRCQWFMGKKSVAEVFPEESLRAFGKNDKM